MSGKSNNKKLKNVQKNKEEPIPIFNNKFSVESEIISNYLVEKLISLSISESLKNTVNKLLPTFCYEKLHQTLDIVTHLDFLSYDKDDYPSKGKRLGKMKSFKNLKNKINIGLPDEAKDLQNSMIIRKYKFDKEYDLNCTSELDIDINISNTDNNNKEEKDNKEDKIVMRILRRESYSEHNNSFQKGENKKESDIKKNNIKNNNNFKEDKKKIVNGINGNEPFIISPEEKIEEIQNVESHKLDIPKNNFDLQNKNIFPKINLAIPFEKIIDSTNFWKPIYQPIPAPIDRDAGTKIKYERPFISKFGKRMISKTISDENKINNEPQIINKEITSSQSTKKKLKKINFYNTINNPLGKGRNKKVIELPFEATDIEPKKLETFKEPDEIQLLRDLVEKTLQEKKKEKEIQLKIAKEKQSKKEALEEMRRELYRKNVTVDVKGEIVYIRPIDMKNIIEEFNKSKVNFKNIKVVETELGNKIDTMNIKVEKNPEDYFKEDLKEEKSKKNKKKKIGFNILQKSINSKSNLALSKELEKRKLLDKEAKLVSGSNFNIINPEIGVNITEDKRMKSGGKDFYKKFSRFSLEVFQEQLSRTSNSFFPKVIEQNDIITHMTERNTTNRKMSNIFNKDNKDKIKNKIKNIKNKQTLSRNNEEKNSLSLKTKNLNIALQDLDLITDREIKELNKTKKIQKTLFLKNVLSDNKTSRENYNEMDKFAKTLVGKENWGTGMYTERGKYDNYKIPKKPEKNQLERELPNNMLKHMPRKRLPPLNTMTKLNTMTGFYIGRKHKKINEIQISNKESI